MLQSLMVRQTQFLLVSMKHSFLLMRRGTPSSCRMVAVQVLSADKVTISADGSSLTFKNLSGSGSGQLVATLRKIKVTAKEKVKLPVQSLIIDKSNVEGSGTGDGTFNDGLTYGNYAFGTRVQDKIICLNKPDVIKVHAIYEANGTDDPEAPVVVLGGIDGESGTTGDLIVGEQFIGEESGLFVHFSSIRMTLVPTSVI